jgi:hypothetical protein
MTPFARMLNAPPAGGRYNPVQASATERALALYQVENAQIDAVELWMDYIIHGQPLLGIVISLCCNAVQQRAQPAPRLSNLPC